jgi:hypothetical protein
MGGILTTICFMCRLNASTKNKNKNSSLLVLGAFSSLILLLIPTPTVFAQVSPWELFQMLCGTGRLVTGPQCQNLSTGTNTCANGLLVAVGVCIPTNTNTGVPNTTTCPPGSTLQNGVCEPFTNPVQSPPVANAGQSQTVTEGFPVSLDGSNSYATTTGATITSYSWTQTSGPTVGLNGATLPSPLFTAPSQPATLTFSLTVTDSLGQVSQPSSVTVTVVAS